MTSYDEIKASSPTGLEDALRALFEANQQKAEPQYLSRDGILHVLRQKGFFAGVKDGAADRQIRDAIKLLRREGFPIISKNNAGGGYRLAATRDELIDTINREFSSRRRDLAETERALLRAAEDRFPSEHTQMALF